MGRWISLLAAVGMEALSCIASADPPTLLFDRPASARPALLVLGTAHFANPKRDLVNPVVDDVSTPKRQQQIEQLLVRMTAFRPTIIAVEWPKQRQTELDRLYEDLRAASIAVPLGEQFQLGLRLAARLELPRVHAVDWNEPPPGPAEAYDYPAWVNRTSRQPTLNSIIASIRRSTIALTPEESLSHWLMRLNQPETLLDIHRTYYDIATLGDDYAQPGAAWVGTWYARNLRIFSNLVGVAARPQDRVLVIYGFGHAHLLRQFAQESRAFELVDLPKILNDP